MKVLVLGAAGFIGQRIVAKLNETDWTTPVLAGRSEPKRPIAGLEYRRVDTMDINSLRNALHDIDAVINCVAGSGEVIAQGARLLVQAALETTKPRIVHMSSMAVYGGQEGDLKEDGPLDPALGWYAKAKVEAEGYMTAYAAAGHKLVMLRPGCVHGPGSEMWVGRIAHLLVDGRLGDIGALGDGWSNLVHVDDVCAAVLLSLKYENASPAPAIFNLAASDSPRWNQYFSDLSMALSVVPVKRVNPKFIRLDAKVGAPIIKILEIIGRKTGVSTKRLPVAVPPSLLRLWGQHIKMNPERAEGLLQFAPRPYAQGVSESAAWALGAGIGKGR